MPGVLQMLGRLPTDATGKPESGRWNGYGVNRQPRSNLEEAVRAYTEVLERDPGPAMAYSNRGFAYPNLGRTEHVKREVNVAMGPGMDRQALEDMVKEVLSRVAGASVSGSGGKARSRPSYLTQARSLACINQLPQRPIPPGTSKIAPI